VGCVPGRHAWRNASRVASQTFTRRSRLAAASRRESGLKATAVKPSVVLVKVRSSCGLVTSQSFTVWSRLAVARQRPSGLKARPVTARACPRTVNASFPVAAYLTETVPPAPDVAR